MLDACRNGGPVALEPSGGHTRIGNQYEAFVNEKLDVQQGTLTLMVLKTIEGMGPLHGYGIARRIEETSGDRLALNYGTLYPALLKLEQEGFIKGEWRVSENNRRARYYALTAAGRKRLARAAREWEQTADIVAAFLAPRPETA
jgi:PadR family transcriptional regulator, regulatory protein PadR